MSEHDDTDAPRPSRVATGSEPFSRGEAQRPRRVVIAGGSRNEAEAILNALRARGIRLRPRVVDDAHELVPEMRARSETDDGSREGATELVVLQADEPVEALAQVRALHQADPSTPVVVLVPRPDEALVERLMNHGASDVVARDRLRHAAQVARRELRNRAERVRARRLERRCRDAELRAAILLESAEDAVAYVQDGVHVHANAAYVRMLGAETLAELRGLPLLDVLLPSDALELRRLMALGRTGQDATGHLGIQPVRGRAFRAAVTLGTTTYGGEACFQLRIRDLTEWDEFRARLRELRIRDRVTGLFNHQHFVRMLARVLAAPRSSPAALLLVELERFRTVRMSLGIAAGDSAVREVAEVLRRHADPRDVVGRMGDHTFAVLSFQRADDVSLEERVGGLRDRVARVVAVGEHQSLCLSCTVAVVRIPPGSEALAADEIMLLADEACREGIRGGGSTVVVRDLERTGEPSPGMSDQEGASHPPWAGVGNALADDAFRLAYQPIVNLRARSRPLYEALLRTRRDGSVPASPGQVYELAAREGACGLLDAWVLDRVVDRLASSPGSRAPPTVFVKLSEQSVRDESVMLHAVRRIRASGIAPGSLVFQVATPVAARQVKSVRAVLEVLNRLGSASALEHFDGSEEAFALLRHLDVDYLKLAAPLLEGIALEPGVQRRLSELRQRAQALGKQTIATGVEDANTLAILWQCGIHLAQGYYIQEPDLDWSYEFAESGTG